MAGKKKVIYGPTNPSMLDTIVGKKLLFKVETKKVGVEQYYGTFRFVVFVMIL